jgi:hypothetical protein
MHPENSIKMSLSLNHSLISVDLQR